MPVLIQSADRAVACTGRPKRCSAAETAQGVVGGLASSRWKGVTPAVCRGRDDG